MSQLQSLGTIHRTDLSACPGPPTNGQRLRTTNQKKPREMRLGILNILSLNKKEEECIDIMIQKKLDIFGISETKRKEHGTEELRGGYHLIWSGGEKKRNGVGLIVTNENKEKITEVLYISDRLLKVNIKLSPWKTPNEKFVKHYTGLRPKLG
uniref:Endonuclease/exonuclease/phosphatase domain-containing protein n=1 Tax=Cacopsylla melanoneura TaxID=428564 RepID=A0A8D8U4R8_9HEMI